MFPCRSIAMKMFSCEEEKICCSQDFSVVLSAVSAKWRTENVREREMTKIMKIAAVMGFAALSAFAGHVMTSHATSGSATHWAVNAGSAH